MDGNNINPKCLIKCSKISKNTKTIHSTNNPYWNEIFFFNFLSSQAELFSDSIELFIYNATKFLRNELIGSFKIEIGYIYDEPFHSILYKWLLLGDLEDYTSGPKGYLKVSINVLGPGDEIPVKINSVLNNVFMTKKNHLLFIKA